MFQNYLLKKISHGFDPKQIPQCQINKRFSLEIFNSYLIKKKNASKTFDYYNFSCYLCTTCRYNKKFYHINYFIF
jgi:hypothetical protein